MKRFFLFFAILSIVAFSQSSWTTNWEKITSGKGVTYSFAGTIDTTNTLNSSPVYLEGYDVSALNVAVLLTGTSTATRKVSAFWQGLWDGSNWTNLDTISTADSANTLLRYILNLNGWKAPIYRLSVVGATTANNDTGFTIKVYAMKQD